MKHVCYIDLNQARDVLCELGVELSLRQLRRVSEPDAHGRRKLPFFVDPIDGRLKINRDKLIQIYIQRDVDAQNNMTLEH